jgi:hypothetical protein
MITMITIIDVIGKKKKLFLFSIRMSPGNFPNQLTNQGAYISARPMNPIIEAIISSNLPIAIIHQLNFFQVYKSKVSKIKLKRGQ